MEIIKKIQIQSFSLANLLCGQAPGYLLLLFMLAVYPLLVIPNQVEQVMPLPRPVAPHTLPPDYFYYPRWLLLLAVAVLAAGLLFKHRHRLRHPAFVPLGIFVVLGLGAAMFADFSNLAWLGSPLHRTGLSTYLAGVMLFMLAFVLIKDADRRLTAKLLEVMVWSAVLVSFLALLQYFDFNLVPRENFRAILHAHGTMATATVLGLYCAFVLPAAAWLFFSSAANHAGYPGRWQRPLKLLALTLVWLGLLVSFNLLVWLAALPGLLLVCLLAWRTFPDRTRSVLLALAVLLLTGLCLWFAGGGWPEMAAISERSLGSLAEVLFVWQEAGALLLQQPFWGVGPDHFVYQGVLTPDRVVVSTARNMYLGLALAVGLPALLAFLTFISFFVRRPAGEIQAVLSIMVLGYLLQGIFSVESLLVLPLFWIVLGLLLGLRSKTAEDVLVSQ